MDVKLFFREIGNIGSSFSPVVLDHIPELGATVGCEQRNPYHKHDVAKHIIETVKVSNALGSLSGISADIFNLSALLHDIGKPLVKKWDEKRKIDRFFNHARVSSEMAELILSRFLIDDRDKETVIFLVKNHDYQIDLNAGKYGDKPFEERFRYISEKYGANLVALLLLGICDSLAQNPAKSAPNVKKGLEYLKKANVRAFEGTVRYIKEHNPNGVWDTATEGI